MAATTISSGTSQVEAPVSTPAAAVPVPETTLATLAVAVSTPEAAPVPIQPLANGPVVAQVQFYGLETVPEDRVRGLLTLREWAPYPSESKDKDVAALLASGEFTSVSITVIPLSAEAVRVDVRLTEGKPLAQAATPLPEAPAQGAPSPALTGLEPSAVPPAPWVIGEFDVQGNRNVKFNVIRAQVQARKGDLYTRADLDRDIQKVLNLGSFERVTADVSELQDRPVPEHFQSVSPSSNTIRLVLHVVEKPLVRKLAFEGRKKLSKGKLLEDAALKERDPFDKTKLREDVDKMLEAYHKKGYHRAGIDTRVAVDTPTHKADITFLIDEGPRALIQEVRIEGTSSKRNLKKARKAMKTRRKKVFSEKQLQEDLAKIEEYYKNEGYLDYRVESSSVSVSTDQTRMTVDLRLFEGPQYRFGDTTFSGNTIYASTELAKAIEYHKGKLFSQKRFDYTIGNIQELLAEKGRLRALVDPKKTRNTTTGLMDVEFAMEEGSTVYVDHVDVEGNKSTKKYVFTREIVVKPGQPFQASKVRKSREKIMNLGFIEDVEFDVQSPFDPNLVDLTFGVVEGKPGMLTAGAGFSSLDGLIGTLSLQHLNLFGRAWRTGLNWSFGSRVNDFSVTWTTPWVANKPVSLGFDAFSTRRISPFEGSNAAYVNKRTGGSVRVGPRFSDDKYQLNTTYTFQQIKVTNVEAAFRNVLSEGTSIQSTLGLEIARDTRDNIWDPAKGSRHAIGASLSGGPLMGDVDIFKPYISNAHHFTLFNIGDYPLVLSASNRGGYVTQFGVTQDVPVYERYFIGGQDSLRGYSVTGEVGARDGGRVYDVFNVELGFPLARERKRTIVKFVTFFDAGGSWANMRNVRAQVGPGETDIKTDVGFGIRFTTPAFPIRLDWGYGLQHRPGEDKTQINFGIGPLF